jgi:riboflavin transporter FmnP
MLNIQIDINIENLLKRCVRNILPFDLVHAYINLQNIMIITMQLKPLLNSKN